MPRLHKLHWWHVPYRLEESAVVEPVDPLERRVLDDVDAASRASPPNRLRFVKPSELRPLDGPAHGTRARADARRHIAVRPPELPLLSQHGQSLRRHRLLFEDDGSLNSVQRRCPGRIRPQSPENARSRGGPPWGHSRKRF